MSSEGPGPGSHAFHLLDLTAMAGQVGKHRL